jgi:hypothetical protein
MWHSRRSARRLHRRWPRRWWRCHRENQSIRELQEHPHLCPPLLLLTDEDGDGELLLLGELGRHLVGLAAVGGLKIVVDDMVDHLAYVIVDYPVIVYLARDLAADMRRRWHLGVVLILEVLVLEFVVLVGIVRVLVGLLVIGGHDGLPVAITVDVAEVTGTPVWAHFPPGDGVPVQGPDVKGGIVTQVHREEGTLPAYLPPALWPVTRYNFLPINRSTISFSVLYNFSALPFSDKENSFFLTWFIEILHT